MRHITVDGKEYEWKVGKSYILIRGEGVKHLASGRDLFPNEDIERARYKKYFHVTPADIRKFILSKEVKNGKN